MTRTTDGDRTTRKDSRGSGGMTFNIVFIDKPLK